MPTKKRCFSSVRALRRLNPEILCQVLGKFPDYLVSRKLSLPRDPVEDSMPYDAILDACMAGDIPHELDDVLFHVSMLGNSTGWDKIQREARSLGLLLNFSVAARSYADLAMKAWLHDWDRNKHLLEQSYARAKIHSRSSYFYYPPMKDVRRRFNTPDAEAIESFRKALSEYFISEGLGKGTNVIVYDFEKEIWFLVRYPGQVQRHPSIEDDGQPNSHVFKPEEYDAVVYHKEYGDLRLNTNRAKDHARYRIAVGDLLLSSSNVFHPRAKVIHLNPLLGESLHIFKCDDVEGLSEIAPVEISFSSVSEPGITHIWRADKDCDLLTHHRDRRRLFTDTGVHSITYAKFRYRLKDHTRKEIVTVYEGNTLTYARDGDSVAIEEWLRRRGFFVDSLGV